MSPETKENELYALLQADLRYELNRYEQSMIVPEGTTLIDHDILQEYLVILNSGTVRVTVRGPQKSIFFFTDEQGKVFGMHAIISGELPEVDLTCMDSCHVTMLPRTAFLSLLKKRPELYLAVAKVLSADIRMANRILREYPWRSSCRAIKNNNIGVIHLAGTSRPNLDPHGQKAEDNLSGGTSFLQKRT